VRSWKRVGFLCRAHSKPLTTISVVLQERQPLGQELATTLQTRTKWRRRAHPVNRMVNRCSEDRAPGATASMFQFSWEKNSTRRPCTRASTESVCTAQWGGQSRARSSNMSRERGVQPADTSWNSRGSSRTLWTACAGKSRRFPNPVGPANDFPAKMQHRFSSSLCRLLCRSLKFAQPPPLPAAAPTSRTQ
jgi:hypothetical protein